MILLNVGHMVFVAVKSCIKKARLAKALKAAKSQKKVQAPIKIELRKVGPQ